MVLPIAFAVTLPSLATVMMLASAADQLTSALTLRYELSAKVPVATN
jgi:hypothetical protein